jgi:hypothetical protein
MSTTLNRETINDTAKLIMHRLIARELVRSPSLVARARTSLEKMAVRFPDRPFVQEWDTVLRRPIDEIVAVLRGRGEDARRLRLSSPFVLAEGIDFKDEALRRRIGQVAKRLAARGSAIADRSPTGPSPTSARSPRESEPSSQPPCLPARNRSNISSTAPA